MKRIARFIAQAVEITVLKRKKRPPVVLTLELTFPRGVTSTRATQVAREIARAIQVDLTENGSDLWPGAVPTVRVEKKRGVTP